GIVLAGGDVGLGAGRGLDLDAAERGARDLVALLVGVPIGEGDLAQVEGAGDGWPGDVREGSGAADLAARNLEGFANLGFEPFDARLHRHPNRGRDIARPADGDGDGERTSLLYGSRLDVRNHREASDVAEVIARRSIGERGLDDANRERLA